MAMTLHVAADHGAVEHVQRGKQRGGAVALVIVGHGAEPALLQRQAGLGAVERLDLALLVERQHDRVGGRVDIEPDHVPELLDEPGVVRELELAHAMRLETMGAPDALDRADADPGLARHHGRGPVGRLEGRIGQRQRDDTCRHLRSERRNARRPRLVAQQPLDAFFGKALLRAPDAGLRLARPAHDLDRAEPVGAEQNDLGSPNVLLSRVVVADQHLQAAVVGWRDLKRDTGAHAPASHAASRGGIPDGTQPSGSVH